MLRPMLSLAVAALLCTPAFADEGAALTNKEKALRVSHVIGMAVYSSDNKEVGSVADVVLNADREVAYAAMSRGGFLGFGDTMFALSWDDLALNKKDDGTLYFKSGHDSKYFMEHEGFDQNHWPASAMTADNDDADDAEENEEEEEADDRATVVPKDYMKASRLLGLTVRNHEGQTLGTIADLVLEPNEATPSYVGVAYDQTFGLFGKHGAFEFGDVTINRDDDGPFAFVEVELEEFKKRQTFPSDDYPACEDISTYLEAKE